MEKQSVRLTPFLSLDGRAAAAINFYKKHLGARVVFLKTYRDMTEYDPEYKYVAAEADRIAHSVLEIGENRLFVSDEPIIAGCRPTPATAISLCIESPSRETVENIYASLTAEENVKIIAPLAENCFSPAYGIIADPFGVIIQLVAE